MATFKSLNESETVDGKYSGRKRIYLESDDDLAIFQRWFFDEGEFIEFLSSKEDESGGCTKVRRAVDKDRNMGIPSFGIVDRDALLRECLWKVFWENDDQAYQAARPFGEYIRPLSRWEIENYLLNPKVIYALLVDYGKYSPDGIDKELLANSLLNQSNNLVPVTAANICLHIAGEKALAPEFVSQENDRTEIDKKCVEHLQNNKVECEFEEVKTQILSFSNGDDTTGQYWCLSRIIDGKRLIVRIKKEFKLKEDHRYNLAKMIKEYNVVSSEIKLLIEEIKAVTSS